MGNLFFQNFTQQTPCLPVVFLNHGKQASSFFHILVLPFKNAGFHVPKHLSVSKLTKGRWFDCTFSSRQRQLYHICTSLVRARFRTRWRSLQLQTKVVTHAVELQSCLAFSRFLLCRKLLQWQSLTLKVFLYCDSLETKEIKALLGHYFQSFKD